MRRSIILLPLLCGVMLALGLLLGKFLNTNSAAGGEIKTFDKLRAVLGFVNEHYVDSINTSALTDKTVAAVLNQLDPHSAYFPAEEMTTLNESLDGNFQGIGVEYNVLNDTITVMAVMPGGPSQKAGILTGDQIIRADGQTLTGSNSATKIVRKFLRGPSGSTVNIDVLRKPSPTLLRYAITRASIPIQSVDIAYMIKDDIGYIRLLRFAETSHEELVKGAEQLLQKGMRKLILDLRGNGGGLLNTAVAIADEFLPEGKMIVYTQGHAESRIDYRATKKGQLEQIPLIVLVDENSASASEVVAGAIQDNDRGTIIGRRSFGKGLVQQERKLADGSGFRLTIARYYSPTGRCIQKPYNKGHSAYANEENDRYERGELLNADSIHFPDSLRFKTPSGKIVYGGGGIMPDIFVPIDTMGRSTWFNAMYATSIFSRFSLEYALTNRAQLEKQGLSFYKTHFSLPASMLEKLIQESGVKRNKAEEERTAALMQYYLKSYIARVIWKDEGFYSLWNEHDKAILAALTELGKN